MSKSWLILDVNYLAWRAHYSTGFLRGPRGPSGVLFGFFRTLDELQRRFGTYRPVFCFDLGEPKRKKVFPGYKLKRQSDTDPRKRADRKAVREQVEKLRTKYLWRVGYRNVFAAAGYEADDVIARVVGCGVGDQDRCFVVSGDKDLYQLLTTPRVFVYHPVTKVLHDRDTFEREFGINPSRWATVKALAGCNTDNVPGLVGVGEATAIKNLVSPSKLTGKAALAVAAALKDKKWMRRQLKLVGLPYPGCPKFEVVDDQRDPEAFGRLMSKLEFKSLKEADRAERS